MTPGIRHVQKNGKTQLSQYYRKQHQTLANTFAKNLFVEINFQNMIFDISFKTQKDLLCVFRFFFSSFFPLCVVLKAQQQEEATKTILFKTFSLYFSL